MAKKVREVFKNPDYSPFTKECVRVGEQLEALGYELQNEHYSQGEQAFNFHKDNFLAHVMVTEDTGLAEE